MVYRVVPDGLRVPFCLTWTAARVAGEESAWPRQPTGPRSGNRHLLPLFKTCWLTTASH